MENETKKTPVSLVVIGQVHAGKSTMAGHLLQKAGVIHKDTIEECEEVAIALDKDPMNKYAFAMDKTRYERERGHTRVIASKYKELESTNHKVAIIDTPGHRAYINDTIAGITQGDVGILVIDASRGRCEAGIKEDGKPTLELPLLAFNLGVKQIIVVCNKMDHETVDYSERRYNNIKTYVLAYLQEIGYMYEKIQFVPISGWVGDNLVENSTNMRWYTGPTLREALDNVIPPTRPITTTALRIPSAARALDRIGV